MRKKIGYGKIGRVTEIDSKKWGTVGGDNESPQLLETLARRNPDVEWVAISRNSGWEPPLPNITNPWQHWAKETKIREGATVTDYVIRYDEITMPTFDELDGIVLWLGQHGTSNSPIPTVRDRQVYTRPYVSFVHYTSFLLRGINRWRMSDPLGREEIWLNADTRTYLKGRDLKWPRQHAILTQYDLARHESCERYGDPRTPEDCGFGHVAKQGDGIWRVRDRYEYHGLELACLQDVDQCAPWDERKYGFGMVINEARNYNMKPELARKSIMREWALPMIPDWVHGGWTEESQQELGMKISGIPYWHQFPMLGQTKSTFTTPTSGSGWPTLKTWEAFQCGAICFMHPRYDDQGHILPTLEQLDQRDPAHSTISEDEAYLTRWLRVESSEQLRKRVAAVESSSQTYEWLARIQREVLEKRKREEQCVRTIERRLGL